MKTEADEIDRLPVLPQTERTSMVSISMTVMSLKPTEQRSDQRAARLGAVRRDWVALIARFDRISQPSPPAPMTRILQVSRRNVLTCTRARLGQPRRALELGDVELFG